MGIRSLLFRFLYPVPQKGEDPLAYKEKFIGEYKSSCRLRLQIKDLFVSYPKRESFCYVKRKNDKEQKAHIEAYKTWRKIACVRQRD